MELYTKFLGFTMSLFGWSGLAARSLWWGILLIHSLCSADHLLAFHKDFFSVSMESFERGLPKSRKAVAVTVFLAAVGPDRIAERTMGIGNRYPM